MRMDMRRRRTRRIMIAATQHIADDSEQLLHQMHGSVAAFSEQQNAATSLADRMYGEPMHECSSLLMITLREEQLGQH